MSQTRHATSKALILTIVLILVAPSFAQVAYAKPKKTIPFEDLIVQEQVCKGVVRYTEFVPITIYGFPELAFYTVNVYAVDTKKGVVLVDSGTEDLAQMLYLRVEATFRRKPIIAVLLTHGHADHAGGGGFFQDKGAAVFVGAGDWQMVEKGNAYEGVPDDFRYTGYTPDATYEASKLPSDFKYHPIPGHTMGSVVLEYKYKKLLFTGDASLPSPDEDINPLDFTSELDYGALDVLKAQAPELLSMQIDSLNSILPLISGKTIMCPGHKGVYKGPQATANIYTAIQTIQYVLTQ
jgi:glyoxylase-like metal-dependent hydrolase (beta-lactamase superfamily II)